MKNLCRFLALSCVVTALLVIAQSRQIGRARADLARRERAAKEQPTRKTPDLAVALEEEIARLKEENRDIYKLRGQISEARKNRNEIERLQAENTRFRHQIEQLTTNPPANSSRPSPLANKGQATPQAALETTFWAMSQGDMESLSQLMPSLASQFENVAPNEKTNALILLKGTASCIEKIEIVDQKVAASDEAHLTVQIAHRKGMDGFPFEGKTTFVLRRTNDNWQVISEKGAE